MRGAPTPELPGSYPTPNSLAALELPSRVGNLGQSPGSLPPRGGTDQIRWGLEIGAQRESGTQMGGGSHIEMARELVIKMGKALGMESQIRGWQGEQPLSPNRLVILLSVLQQLGKDTQMGVLAFRGRTSSTERKETCS